MHLPKLYDKMRNSTHDTARSTKALNYYSSVELLTYNFLSLTSGIHAIFQIRLKFVCLQTLSKISANFFPTQIILSDSFCPF